MNKYLPKHITISKFNIGDKVIYIGFNDGLRWSLERYKTYTISNRAFEVRKDTGMFYSLTDDRGTHKSWFKENEFISIIEARKLKLEKLKGDEN